MTTEPELLNERLERLAMVLDEIMPNCALLVRDVLELLKEQDDMCKELTDAMELVRKKNERIEKLLKELETQKFFVDESGKITPLPIVVRCKDCKHYDKTDCSDVFGWCNRNGEGCGRTDEWFCADGERK